MLYFRGNMLKGLNFFLLLIVFLSCGVGKGKGVVSQHIADCEGAINLFNAGNSVVDLPGTTGKKAEFRAYHVLKNIKIVNEVWFSFIADYDGKFILRADTEINDLNLVVFQTSGRNICADIASGKAEIKRMLIKEDYPSIWLTDRNIKNALYPIEMRKGDKINFVIFTKKKRKTRIKLYVELLPNVVEHIVSSSDNKSKVIDLTDEFASNKTRIEIRDVKSGDPVVANIRLNGITNVKGQYKASDLILRPDKGGTLQIECDQSGYFFVDQKEDVNPKRDKTITIHFKRVEKGESMQLEEIQFKPNSSELLASGRPVLVRLREFLALNADMQVEIQGHVFEKGKSTNDGLLVSQARAKRVMKYLVDSGINAKRMKAVGYGGSKPVYANPKKASEEQANRRVEIKIL